MTSLALHSAASVDQPVGTFNTKDQYEIAMRQATALAASTLVPTAYQNNPANCFMALELATRVGASPMMVMQNVHIIEGKPGWSSQFVIAAINASKRFSPLRFDIKELGEQTITVEEWYGPKDNRQKRSVQMTVVAFECRAYAKSLEDGEMIRGPKVTTAIAIAEGWYGRKGSKWKTMPELMFMYRAAAFFGRMYCPDILMGMQTAEEIEDVHGVDQRWEPDPMAAAAPAPVVDPQRVEFDEVMKSPLWNAKQRDSLVKRYAAADAEGRAALIAAAKKQVAPQEVEVQQAVVVESTPLPQPEPTTGDLFQDDRDLTEEQP